jgi:phosphoglycolate phosphatase
MFGNVRAWLFDFDGTLIQQEIDFARMRQVVQEIVRRYGVDVEPLAGMFVLEMIAQARTLLRDGQAATFYQEAHQAVIDIELDAATRAYAFPGVPEMLRQLRARGLGVGIVTRNCRPAVERVLAQSAIPYDVLLTRDDIAHVKPDPRHLLAALEILHVPGDQAAMCGDHPSDVLVGQRVGAATVGVLSPGHGPEYFADVHPDLIVAQVTDVLAHLSAH